jgi:hypothetical protein
MKRVLFVFAAIVAAAAYAFGAETVVEPSGIIPGSDNFETLGLPTLRFNMLYVNGVSDGTNTVAIANIANKSIASESSAGLMSATDKVKMNAIALQNLTPATSTKLGVVKVDNTTITIAVDGTLSVITDPDIAALPGDGEANDVLVWDALTLAPKWKDPATSLPQAGSDSYGVVMLGEGINTDANGGITWSRTIEDEESWTGNYWRDPADDTDYKIYSVMVDIGPLPNADSEEVAHNIANIFKILDVSGFASNGTNFLPLPYAAVTAANTIALHADDTNITVETGADRTGYTEAYATMLYICSDR